MFPSSRSSRTSKSFVTATNSLTGLVPKKHKKIERGSIAFVFDQNQYVAKNMKELIVSENADISGCQDLSKTGILRQFIIESHSSTIELYNGGYYEGTNKHFLIFSIHFENL